MKIGKRQYRIVTDGYLGFEVQKRLWYYIFWVEIRDEDNRITNTNPTIKQAEKLIEIDKAISKRERHKSKVVKTFNYE